MTIPAISAGWRAPQNVLVEACMPPDVPVPRRGPCPGKGGGTTSGIAKTVRRAVVPGRPVRLDVSNRLNYAELVKRIPTRGTLDDQAMGDIARRQGFDARPHTVSAADFDSALQAGGTEVWRGHLGEPRATPGQQIAKFLTGEATYNAGLWGSGYGATTDRASLDTNGVRRENQLRILLPKESKIVDLAQLEQLRDKGAKAAASTQRRLFRALDAANGQTTRDSALRNLQEWTARQPDRERILRDAGRYAAALGYDAVRLKRQGEPDRYLIANRGKLMVEQPSLAASAAPASNVSSLLDYLSARITAGLPDQLRDPDGKWGDGIPGPQEIAEKLMPGELERLMSYNQEDYDSDFGDVEDEFPFFNGQAHVRVFTDGTSQVTNDFTGADGDTNYQPLTLQLNSDQLSEMESALDDAMNIDMSDYEDADGEADTDQFGAVDSFDGGGLRFAPYGNGDIQVRIPRPLHSFEEDRSEQHAWDLSEEDAKQLRSALFEAIRLQAQIEQDLEQDDSNAAANGRATVEGAGPQGTSYRRP